MNIHHLKLFYYVARHGGITEAVRNIPYGIQQPAVSGQVAQLEEYLGVVLFQRRPFSLTPAGEKLYQFIYPFFANLDKIGGELQNGKRQHLRVGASTIVLRDHLPKFLRAVCDKYPNLKIALHEGFQPELEAMLLRQELDIAVTLIDKSPAPGIRTHGMVELPMVLLVGKDSKLTTCEELWRQDPIREPLICLPEAESVCKQFQQGLQRLGVDWFPSIEVSSIDLIHAYVANGFGVGVSVQVPSMSLPPNVRTLALPRKEFEPVVIGALWHGKPGSLQQLFMDELEARARQLGMPTVTSRR